MTPDASRMRESRAKSKKMNPPPVKAPPKTSAEKKRKSRAKSKKINPPPVKAPPKTSAEMTRKSREKQFLSVLETDTGFESICCICMEFKSKSVCKYNIINLPISALKKYTYRTKASINIDGEYYVCNECRQHIKAKKMPPKSQRDLFQLSTFPQSFLNQVLEVLGSKEKIKLNKVEQFLLKLVIPFIRVAHCERGQQMQVRGNLILISADVAKSLKTILPMEQNILPLKFKRKLSYDGHYIAEFVDKRKIELYFNWMKDNNPLYKDITIDKYDALLEKFERDLNTDANEILKMSIPQTEDTNQDAEDDELEDEIDILQDSDPLEEENPNDHSDKVKVWQQH